MTPRSRRLTHAREGTRLRNALLEGAHYQEGVELAMVSRILGHSSIDTTRVYATPSMKQMRDAMGAVARVGEPEKASWESDKDRRARLCGLR